MGRAWQGREKTNKQLHSSTKYYLKAGVVEMEEMEPPVFPPKKTYSLKCFSYLSSNVWF